MQPVSECTPRRAEPQQDLPVEGERLRDGIRTIGGVDDVVDDFQAVRVGDLAGAPGAEPGAVAVEDDDRRVPALEDVDAVLTVGGDAAYQAETLAIWEFEEIADHFVGVGLGHCCFPPGDDYSIAVS